MEAKQSITAESGRTPAGSFTSFGGRRLGTILGASVLALAALMTTGVGISNAATIQTEGTYPSRRACAEAGSGVKATTPGNWTNFVCVPDDRAAAGTWRLVLTN
jgi:hypothetical protein